MPLRLKTVLFLTALAMVSAHTALAQDVTARDRDVAGSTSGTGGQVAGDIRDHVPDRRERGIPREFVKPGDGAESHDGHREGVPRLQQQFPGRSPDAAPYWIPPRTQWKLGVYAQNTESGVVVTRVVRGSPAARSGLEPGDRIVTVAGHQVGYVGDRLFPLGYEFEHHAGRRGEVLLLVQNVRDRSLINLDVRLQRDDDFD